MIPIFSPEFGVRERDYLLECIDTGWISSQGKFVQSFEHALSSRMGMPYGISCSNCTTALHLAIVALGIGPGDEVICPDLTFIAPANMVRLSGASCVLADVDPISWGLNANSVRSRITSRTRAIIVVHAFGHSADMDPLMEIAEEYKLAIIEDVAEAPDARYKGRVVGTFGKASCYSFYGNKIITTGEGGMILCGDEELSNRLRILRDHGMSVERRYIHEVAGFNYRLTNMQAAIGLAQVERMDQIQKQRSQQQRMYQEYFSQSDRLVWRPVEPWCESVHWLSTISLHCKELRDNLLTYLKSCGIEGRPMIYPVHRALPFRDCGNDDDFPISTDISLRSLHLPSGTNLQPSDIERVATEVMGWLTHNAG